MKLFLKTFITVAALSGLAFFLMVLWAYAPYYLPSWMKYWIVATAKTSNGQPFCIIKEIQEEHENVYLYSKMTGTGWEVNYFMNSKNEGALGKLEIQADEFRKKVVVLRNNTLFKEFSFPDRQISSRTINNSDRGIEEFTGSSCQELLGELRRRESGKIGF